MAVVQRRLGKKLRHSVAVAAAAFAAISGKPVSNSAFADTLTWDPGQTNGTTGGGSGVWDTTSSFWFSQANSIDQPWAAGAAVTDAAVFANTPGTVTINTGTGVSAGGLTFNTGGYIINSNVAADVLTLNGTPIITVANGGDTATINAIIAGTAATLQKSGSGTLVLTGTNTYTGKTVINGGTLSISADANLGAAPAAAVLDQLQLGGGTLKFTGAVTLAANRGVAFNTGSSNTLDANGNTITFSGQVANAMGPGTSVRFSNSSATAATYILAASVTTNADATSSITVDPNVTVTLGNAGTAGNLGGNTAPINLNGATAVLRFNRTNATSYNAAISGTGSLSIANNATQIVTLSTANSYSGGTVLGGTSATILGGTDTSFGTGLINFSAGGGIASSSATAHTWANDLSISGTTTFGQTSGGTGAMTFTGAVNLNQATRTFTVNQATTIAGVISNGGATAAGITKGAAGNLTLTGANTFTGNIQINTAQVAVTGANGSVSSAAIIIGDANGADESMIFGAAGDVWTSGSTVNRIADTGTVTMNGRTAMTYNGPANGSSGFNEVFGTFTTGLGANLLTLNPGSGSPSGIQLSPGTLTRTSNATLLLRGDNLSGTGAGSTRVVVGTAPTLSGAGSSIGTNQSILPWVVGDTSSTGAGSTFVTYDNTVGIKPLAAGDYDTTIAGTTALRNVTTAGGETVSSSVAINALRLTGTGTTTVAGGQRLGVKSGAVLFTGAGTLGGAGTVDFGNAEGIVYVAGNSATTATISAGLAGTGGLTYSGIGNLTAGTLLPNVLVLSGDNSRLLGPLTINSGTVKAGSTSALNPAYPMAIAGRPQTVFQLNGNSLIVRDLASAAGQLLVQNANATPATLTTYLTAARTIANTVSDGTGGGALSLVVSGGQTLTASVTQTFTGSLEVRNGTFLQNSNGTTEAFTSLLLTGGTLRLTNASGSTSNTRIPDATTVAMYGGTFDYDNNASAASFSETVGAVTLNGGANTITVDKAASAQTSALTFASLNRAAGSGATVNFTSQNNGTAIFDLGTTTQSRLVFTTAPTLDDGIIGGWATVDSSATAREFATYVASGTISATAVTGSTATLSSGANPSQNVRITATPAALSSATQINSLNLAQASATTVDLGGNTLRVESGGVIVSNAFNATISNGTLTAGTGTDAAGELFFHIVPPAANPATVSATIADNGAGSVSVVKSGAGLLILAGTNTYTGKTTVNAGTLRVTSDANLGTAPASPTAGALTLSGGSTLDVPTGFTLNANRGIVIGPGSNIISITAGVAGAGQTLTYNGSITSAGTTEGSLQFKANVVATTGVDPGKFNGTLSAANINGTLRLDAGTVTVIGATNTIGRGLQVGMDGVGSLTYSNAGGSLSVGKGINDVLEIGVNATNILNTTGTLDLSALSNFTANVDTVRLGIAGASFSGKGVLILPANSSITAGTSILVGDTGNAGNQSVTSSIAFGSGTSNVTTRTMTIGGNKSIAGVTVAAGGTVNLGGFGANTMDLIVGAYGNTGGGGSTSTFNMTGGNLVADLNNFTVGQKTGGSSGGISGIVTLPGSGNNITANALTLGTVSGNNAAGTNTTAGTLTLGGGTMTVLGNVNLALFGTNTGSTPTSAGTLTLNGGTFTVAGNILSNGALNASATSKVTLAGGTLVMANSGSVSVDTFDAQSGTIQNLGGLFQENGTTAAPLVKTTTGTLTITGTGNAYTGGTTVSAGTLVVNGNLTATANAVSVNVGTIKGGGSIAGPLTVGNSTGTADSHLAPGNSVGTLASGALTLNNDSVYDAEIDTTAGTADRINITGNLSIVGAGLTVTDLGGNQQLAQGTSLPIATYSGTWDGGLLSVGGTPITDEGNTFFVGTNEFQIDYNQGGNTVALVAVPEPATVGVIALAGLGLLARRRKRVSVK